MRKALVFFALGLAAALPRGGAAQADAPVPEPAVKAGESWTYRRDPAGSYNPGEVYQMRVTFAGRNAIHVVVIGKDGRELDATFTPEWNDVVSPTGRINARARGELQFPLQLGVKYALEWYVDAPQAGHPALGEAGAHQRSVRVVRWEEVVVPAGKFLALRVESEGRYQRDRNSGLVLEVFWYAPEVKRWVKHQYEWTHLSNRGSHRDRGGEELIEFKVQ